MISSSLNPNTRSRLEEILRKRFFYAPAFSIYGGVSGLYDYGPPGCAVQANILQFWRNFFVLEESMLEMDTTILTPYDVLKASGHVDRFTDYMVKDSVTGDVYRADHILKAFLQKILQSDQSTSQEKEKAEFDLAQLDGMDGQALHQKLVEYKVKSDLDNPLSDVVKFNLMFGADIGPSGALKGYLRPETAQGQFVNFKRLLECNYDRMPFASAQIGRSFRNEISPRSGLIRVREFTMAEIEHYVHPEKKNHPKFAKVSHIKLPLLSRPVQEQGSSNITWTDIGTAVKTGMVNNETLGYFLVRIYEFLIKIGVHSDKIRFRQHHSNEMAHYASDCWDAEIFNSYGWIECVGCADRAAFDLTVHSHKTKEKLVAREKFDNPVTITKLKLELNKKEIGSTFRKDSKEICDIMENMDEHSLAKIQTCMEYTGSAFYDIELDDCRKIKLPSSMFTIQKVSETCHTREYIPSVIEPSFGIGRIIWSLFEHAFWTRSEDDQKTVLSLPAFIAPTKCLIAPIMSQDIFSDAVEDIAASLRKKEVSCQVDQSGTSLGKKYARNDEIGVPFSITVDHRTLQDQTVTIRERDSTFQIRIEISQLPDIMRSLIQQDDGITWQEALLRYEVVAPTVTD